MKKILLCAFMWLSLTGTVSAADPDPLQGKTIFQKNCNSCHSIQNQIVGPALRNVFDRHSEAWIIKFVHSSQSVIKSGDTAAVRLFTAFNQTVMPDHPNLSDQDIKNIIGYIRAESKNAVVQLPAPTVTVEDNDPYKGESGFVRQVVYIDLPGIHSPILPGDYRFWFVIGALIILSLLTLFTLIKAKTIITFLNKKFEKPTHD
jgi:cytochrome c2